MEHERRHLSVQEGRIDFAGITFPLFVKYSWPLFFKRFAMTCFHSFSFFCRFLDRFLLLTAGSGSTTSLIPKSAVILACSGDLLLELEELLLELQELLLELDELLLELEELDKVLVREDVLLRTTCLAR